MDAQTALASALAKQGVILTPSLTRRVILDLQDMGHELAPSVTVPMPFSRPLLEDAINRLHQVDRKVTAAKATLEGSADVLRLGRAL